MNQTSSRRILLLAPHQDDECLQTAAFINFQIDMLDAITVVIALCHITDFQF